MLLDFGHGVADGWIRVEKVMVLPGIPFTESREFLRNGGKETNDDPDWCSLHVVAKFLNGHRILDSLASSQKGKAQKTLLGLGSGNQIASPPIRRAGWPPG